MCRPSTRQALTALLALAMLLIAPAAARAACAAQPLQRTFLPWLDTAWYEPAPDGAMESGAAGWRLAGGAAVVNGNDPFLPGARLLFLPAGGSATTPPICVDLAHPTIRFFTRGSGPMTVTALFAGQQLPVGVVTPGSSWAPSPASLIVGNLVTDSVSFRFDAAGSAQLDDVWVDPYSKG